MLDLQQDLHSQECPKPPLKLLCARENMNPSLRCFNGAKLFQNTVIYE